MAKWKLANINSDLFAINKLTVLCCDRLDIFSAGGISTCAHSVVPAGVVSLKNMKINLADNYLYILKNSLNIYAQQFMSSSKESNLPEPIDPRLFSLKRQIP